MLMGRDDSSETISRAPQIVSVSIYQTSKINASPKIKRKSCELDDDEKEACCRKLKKGRFITEEGIEKKHYSEEIVQSLSEDQQNDCCCDVKFLIQGESIPAHRSVLKAKSSYFKAMFSGLFTEAKQKIVELKEVTPNSFRIILDYVYGRDFEITMENLEEVYNTSDMFCMNELTQECKMSLELVWDPQKVCLLDPRKSVEMFMAYLKLSERMGFKAHYFIVTFRKEVVKSPEALNIMLAIPFSLAELILDVKHHWNIAHEVNKLLFLTELIKNNPGENISHLSNILTAINFNHIPNDISNEVLKRLSSFRLNPAYNEANQFALSQFHSKLIHSGIKAKNDKTTQNYVICLFYQNPDSLEADVRVYREEEPNWKVKTLRLDVLIIQSVKIEDSLILLSQRCFYIVDLFNFEVTLKLTRNLERFKSGFVACAQGTQLIVSGKLKFKRGKKEVIVVCDFWYKKKKPSLVQLFFFKDVAEDLVALSASSDAIYLLTSTRGPLSANVLSVKHDSYLGNHSVEGLSVNAGKNFSSRIFLNYRSNEYLFLMDSFFRSVAFSGAFVLLVDCPEPCEVSDRITNLDKVKHQKWVGLIMGTLLSNCQSKEGHLLLIAQGDHLVIFDMKNLNDFEVLHVLPRFSSAFPKLDFEMTNVFIQV